MAPVILVDANIEGQAAHIWRRLQSAEWQEMTAALQVRFVTIRDVGLKVSLSDNAIWRFCQAQGYYLLTSNRNAKSADSLEATMRREGTESSLPVFTLPVPDRVYHSPAFLERVVAKLLDFLLFADDFRGAGRLYLP